MTFHYSKILKWEYDIISHNIKRWSLMLFFDSNVSILAKNIDLLFVYRYFEGKRDGIKKLIKFTEILIGQWPFVVDNYFY